MLFAYHYKKKRETTCLYSERFYCCKKCTSVELLYKIVTLHVVIIIAYIGARLQIVDCEKNTVNNTLISNGLRIHIVY